MAFVNRVSSLLKNTVSKHVSSELSASSPCFQAIRSMSTSSKLFVGGLSYSTDEPSLREEFSKYGEVVEARVIMDRDTGRSRGFAFVTYTSPESASSAIQACDGQDLHGRRIRVNFATEKPRIGGFGGGGYDGGGYGGGGGGYGGGRYQGGGGYGGGGEYGGGNQYPSGGGGGYGGGNQYPSGSGSGVGGGDSYTGFGGSGTNSFSGGQSGFSSPDETATGAFGDPIQSDQIGIDAEEGDIVKDGSESDVPDDFANRR